MVSKVDYVSSDLTVERVKRGDYAINGTITLHKDIGPKYQVSYFERVSTLQFKELAQFSSRLFRSTRGNDDYKPLPFDIPKQSLEEFYNGVYKRALMDDLHKCSTCPYFEDKWEGVLKAQTYEINMCKVNVDNWPDTAPSGFYKMVSSFYDEEDNVIVELNVVLDIESNLGLVK